MMSRAVVHDHDDHQIGEEHGEIPGIAVAGTAEGSDVRHAGGDRGYQLYRRRWYVLFLFSTITCVQCLVWNTFGPIDRAVRFAYNWSNASVAMVANWGPITFVIGVLPFTWLFHRFGLRSTTVLVATLMFVGTVVRTMTTGHEALFAASVHFCAVLNGLAGVTLLSAPPAISASWFPPSERTTSTSICQLSGNLGGALSYLLGPYVVPDNDINVNGYSVNGSWPGEGEHHYQSQDRVRVRLQNYLLGQAVIVGVVFVLVLSYFPSFPPSPPSASGAERRTDFKVGTRKLVSDGNIWLCSIAFALSGGVAGAFSAVMPIDFQPLGINDSESGWIGVTASLAGCLATLVIAFIVDHLKKRMKATLLILMMSCALSFFWMALISLQLITVEKWHLYASVILGSCFSYAMSPLFFEYSVELSYPVSEATVGAFLMTLNNFVGFLFLCIFFVPLQSVAWMNYLLVAAPTFAIPLVLLTKASYRRLQVDLDDSSHDYAVLNE